MIRFACPTCRVILESPDNSQGQKITCPRCGQRLQIPAPPQPRTPRGSLSLPTRPEIRRTMPQGIAPLPWIAPTPNPTSFAGRDELSAPGLTPEVARPFLDVYDGTTVPPVRASNLEGRNTAETDGEPDYQAACRRKRVRSLALALCVAGTCGLLVALLIVFKVLDGMQAEKVSAIRTPAKEFGRIAQASTEETSRGAADVGQSTDAVKREPKDTQPPVRSEPATPEAREYRPPAQPSFPPSISDPRLRPREPDIARETLGPSIDSIRSRAKDTTSIGTPIPGYRQYAIHGFTALVHNDVIEHSDDPTFLLEPLDVLDLELGTIATVLPTQSVSLLRTLLVWVEWDDVTDPDYHKSVLAKYYGVFGNQRHWALGAGKHPLKANSVEIINMKALTAEHQPGRDSGRSVLLHEMAHAVHIHVLGADNNVVKSAYKQAMDRNLYDESRDNRGRKIINPYARTNETEYFAEITCAYLSRLNYYPFARDDLQQHDPVGYRLMELTWGSPKQLAAALQADAERVGTIKLKNARRLLDQKKTDQACEALQKLVTEHPKTKAAADAEKLLEKTREASGLR